MQRLNIPYFACSLLLLVLGTAQTVSTDSGDKPSRVIHLIERVQAVSFQDPDPTGTSLGDRIIFTSNLFDEKGHQVGQDGADCVIVRIASRLAIEHQGAIFNVAVRTTVKLLPLSAQIKTGLENMQDGFRKIYKDTDLHMRLEDRGDTWAYIAELCPVCAGKESDAHICWSWIGTLQEGTLWLTGKELEIEEVECRAQGAPACVWEISKTPKQ